LSHVVLLVTSGKSRADFRASCARQEGRFAIVTNVGAGCDGRLRAPDDARFRADGEVVWSWHPDADAKRATMLRIALATVARKPVTGESTKEAVKTNRAGNAGMFGEPVVTYLRAFYLHAELRVRSRTGIPCALCF
jgi:hypothetical protein